MSPPETARLYRKDHTLSRFFHPLIMMLASMSRSELARNVQYLKAENEILRSKLPKRITVTPSERQRLLKFGKAVGSAIKHLITIVSHRTFLRWLAGGRSPRKPGKRGRPRTAEEIRQIIIRVARKPAGAIPASWVNCGSWASGALDVPRSLIY